MTDDINPKPGQRVRILRGCPPYFDAGATARLVSQDSDGGWWADVQPSQGDGRWYVGAPVQDFEAITDTDTDAKAKLEAAAPDMLEALRNVARCSEEYNIPPYDCPMMVVVRAAIAKAEGKA